MSKRITVVIGCVWVVAALALQPLAAGDGVPGGQKQKGKPGTPPPFATFSVLPSLGANSVAYAVDEAGTVIVGQAFDRGGLLHAVKWTLQNGSWVMTELPWPADAVSASARGVDNQGVAAGNDFTGSTSRPLLWPAGGGPTILGCPSDLGRADVHGISAAGEVVVGNMFGGGASVWRPGSCRENLPRLVEAGSAGAYAVNGDGTIIGGDAALTVPDAPRVPVRWRNVGGQWSIEQLDTRSGSVRGANAAGDLAGSINVPCGSDNDCQRAVIWYALGSFLQLDTLGGDDSVAYDINASGEIVGMSTSPNVGLTAFFWSKSAGLVQLPFKGRAPLALALSNVRPDGTRLVVGVNSNAQAMVWIVRNP